MTVGYITCVVSLNGKDPGSIAEDGGGSDECGSTLVCGHTNILKEEGTCISCSQSALRSHSHAVYLGSRDHPWAEYCIEAFWGRYNDSRDSLSIISPCDDLEYRK